ncbi:DMT family transporter [Amycolatopsis keratiniphila]|uniref:DMT family transporter n=1 Tax=Amycolatopsis keratiniphila TaxID=129921 RepID=UPI00087BA404|nr:EamA family transporter [Amycolatopsis keratiniphila]OLZ48564.1 EamA family transporter [Amycolatopsis keratiniphila subsp. nogabecina]SDU36803.1 drug/metabolite transporter, DME family [Amycolatopsis keratiniphila]
MSVAVPTRARSSAALVLAGVLWGTGGLAGSLLASRAGLHPLSVAAYRLLIGGVIATGYLWLTGGLRGFPRTPQVRRRLLAVGGLFAFFQTSYFASVSLSSVSVATMTTIGSAPVLLAVATAVKTRRLPGAWTAVSVAGSLVGLALLQWTPGQEVDVAGVLFALLAAAGFAALTLVTATRVEGLDPLPTTAFGCLIGGAALTPAALWFGMAVPLQADVLALVVYFGVVPTALAYAAYFRGLESAHPVLAALSALLEPLTAALLSMAVLGDRLGAVGWCGAMVLIAALAVAYSKP